MRILILIIIVMAFCVDVNAQLEGYAPSKGVSIYYRIYGEGDPVLIINGGPGLNSNGFEGLAKLISNGNKAIIYDQRGTGKSKLNKVDSSNMTMDLMIEDIEAVRQHLKFESWSVLGHSFGGMLASYYASTKPEAIKRMVLSASAGIDLDLLTYISDNVRKDMTEAEVDSLEKWTNEVWIGDESNNANIKRSELLAPVYVYNKQHVTVIAKRLIEANFKINSLLFSDMSKMEFNCSEKLKNFKNPVLIIQGRQDIIEFKTAMVAKTVLPNSELVILDECGHYGWLDQKEKYLDKVLGFLSNDD